MTARAAAGCSQLQSFQSARSSFGSQMDVERIICFAFIASRAVFLDCAPLFLVTGDTHFSHLSGVVEVYSPERTIYVYELQC